jgi:hypothetical protein
MSKKSKKISKKIFFITVGVVIVLFGLYLWHQSDKQNNNVTHTTKHSATKSTTSTPVSPKVSSSNLSSGGIVNNNNQTNNTLPPSSEWAISNSGDITLQQPIANSTIQSGDTLSGLANVNNVQFILTDRAVGLIAQGDLNVVNDKFSGTLQFTPHASTGTLQVYYPNPNNGAEEDVVNIDVNFNY